MKGIVNHGLLRLHSGFRNRHLVPPGEKTRIIEWKRRARAGKIVYLLHVVGLGGADYGWGWADLDTFANRWVRGLFRFLTHQLHVIWIPLLMVILAALVLFAS